MQLTRHMASIALEKNANTALGMAKKKSLLIPEGVWNEENQTKFAAYSQQLQVIVPTVANVP